MHCFLCLPLEIRQRIYRHHFVWQRPIQPGVVNEYPSNTLSNVFRLSRTVYHESSKIFYGENVFHFQSTEGLYAFLSDIRDQRKLVRRISFYYRGFFSNSAFKLLKQADYLNELIIDVPSQFENKTCLHSPPGSLPDQAKDFTAPLITTLRGLRYLRDLRGVRDLTITGLSNPEILGKWLTDLKDPPLPGGYKRRGSFPFMQLPPELRYQVYKHHLCFEHDIGPLVRIPTSNLRSGRNHCIEYRQRPTPSGLALLQVSRQIHAEAVSIFYRCNRFVMRGESQLSILTNNIGAVRRAYISDLSIYDREISWSIAHRLRSARGEYYNHCQPTLVRVIYDNHLVNYPSLKHLRLYFKDLGSTIVKLTKEEKRKWASRALARSLTYTLTSQDLAAFEQAAFLKLNKIHHLRGLKTFEIHDLDQDTRHVEVVQRYRSWLESKVYWNFPA
ncbi:hypothetical protein L228DRAFT_57061 [Xylona heveae TC161]|uniref:DUF7730 domain-containing protein n=1 Tax=Xylona heveae (strain CBS 132557 / TC161) TaxID=1328760 RepID=A0A161TR13_XYLHT|nr:hypothetical protein L228DRAFT_57061 [Xylona heveae TC161]KZF24846.1 hypothetical protein L228DRAFT_57061 [Xylona heveae TC161]